MEHETGMQVGTIDARHRGAHRSQSHDVGPADMPDLHQMLERLRTVAGRMEKQGDQLGAAITRIYGEGEGLKGASAVAKQVGLNTEMFEVIHRMEEQITRIEDKTGILTRFV